MDDLLLYVHLGFLTLAFVGMARADTAAFGWLRGTHTSIDLKAARTAHTIVLLGLSGLVGTGLWMFWPMSEYLLRQPLFWGKMAFVGALIVNSFFIEVLMCVAERPFASLAMREKLPLLISGGVSTLSWLGAVTTAILLFGWPF